MDDTVNAQRTDFSIDENSDELLVKAITWQAIHDKVFDSCRTFLKPYTDPVRDQKQRRVEHFVASDGAMYRPILKYVADKIDLIDPETTDDALDIKLYQAYHDLQVQLRVDGTKLLQKEVKDEEWEAFRAQLDEYFDKVSDINKSDLARYVCHRKAVLEFLQKQIGTNDSDKYRREERIHQIIFPLRKTSDEVSFDGHNLWLLNENLVYHAFLASDKPLRTNPKISTECPKEPDILVFDKACAFAAGTDIPFSAVTIIEFKRPMRNDYDGEENPFVQFREYITEIREGKART
ncbi:MAG: ATP-binding protein, partial [Limisphaerales bacterium]